MNSKNSEVLLQLKQIQLQSLLEVTSSINRNESAKNLYKIFGFTLKGQFKLEKLIIFYRADSNWSKVHSFGISEEEQEKIKIDPSWHMQSDIVELSQTNLSIRHYFDSMIPVRHKNEPLAYVMLSGLDQTDEITKSETLSFINTLTNILMVAIENKRLFKRQLQQERMRQEMELAVRVQSLLIPTELPDNQNFEMAAIYRPHRNIGGDYYDVIQEKNKVVVCIADVSGKGIAAALQMANFQAILRAKTEQDLPLIDLIRELNQSVVRITNCERFLSLFLCRYDISKRELEYVNAGHPPPYLISKGKTQLLETGTTLIGSFEDLPFVNSAKVEIEPDSILFMYTDGVTELENEKGVFFEEERLNAFIDKKKYDSSRQLNKELLETIEEFKGEADYSDDITVLSWKIF